jgi:anti-anti-sigma factor
VELDQSKHGDVVVLGPMGSLNTETSPKLEQKVVELLNASERWFVIDFAKVDYISSAGLRVLLMMGKRLRAMGGAVALSTLNKDVAKVFTLSGFEREFTIAPTRHEALERLFSGTASPAPAPAAAHAAPAHAAPPPAAEPEPAAPPELPPPPPPPPAAEPAPVAAAAPEAAASPLADEARRALAGGLTHRLRASGDEAPADLVERAKRALRASA